MFFIVVEIDIDLGFLGGFRCKSVIAKVFEFFTAFFLIEISYVRPS